MSQRSTRQRIREISSQINDLSEELERLLRIEENSNQADPAPNTHRHIRIGDHVEITNTYLGRFGATRGSKGVINGIHRNIVTLRLDSNGAEVSRGIANVRLVEQQNARNAQ